MIFTALFNLRRTLAYVSDDVLVSKTMARIWELLTAASTLQSSLVRYLIALMLSFMIVELCSLSATNFLHSMVMPPHTDPESPLAAE